ncbi:DUF2521 family protein [Bacillus sp. JJ722]|uniref:DUF2521 family protein n=1 Tax=Bacillus sp. JJ722 TaxID=3122973 RepID=UPI002FFF4EF6
MDNVIFTFKEKRRDKQLRYERKVLKDLTPKLLKERFNAFLSNQRSLGITFSQVLEEGCYDVAIEAYLLGANFSKFGFYGESVDNIKARCFHEEKHLIDTLFNFILYWGKISDYDMYNESLYYQCEQYVDNWWHDGFAKGSKRYKLRQH